MRSSTSSSELDAGWPGGRPVEGGWGLALGLAASVLVAGMGMAEWAARAAGHTPSVSEDDALWARQRDRVDALGARALVVVGGSRVRLGLDPVALADGLGRPVVPLARIGESGHAVLEDLATGPVVPGAVLLGVTEFNVFTEVADRPRPAAWLRYRDRRGPADLLEVALRVEVESRLAFRGLQVSWKRWLAALVRGQAPALPPYQQDGGRDARLLPHAGAAELARRDRELAARIEAMRPAAGAEVGANAARRARMVEAVRALRDRGVTVVLLRMPSSGAVRAAEAARFPRSEFWDPLVDQARGPALHFEDEPALAGITCCEGSHLCEAERAEFTRRLLPRLREVLD